MLQTFYLPQYDDSTVNVEDIEDSVARAVEKYKNHPIIRLIKENYRNTNNNFHFENVSAKEIKKELKNLLSSKAAQGYDIPTKVIKDNVDIFTPILLEEFNKSLALGSFPSSMKLANIISGIQLYNQQYHQKLSLLNCVGCVITWVTWIRGLRGHVGAWVTWVKFLRTLRGLRGSKCFLRGSKCFLRGSTCYMGHNFTWVAWVKYIFVLVNFFTWFNIFCVT